MFQPMTLLALSVFLAVFPGFANPLKHTFPAIAQIRTIHVTGKPDRGGDYDDPDVLKSITHYMNAQSDGYHGMTWALEPEREFHYKLNTDSGIYDVVENGTMVGRGEYRNFLWKTDTKLVHCLKAIGEYVVKPEDQFRATKNVHVTSDQVRAVCLSLASQ